MQKRLIIAALSLLLPFGALFGGPVQESASGFSKKSYFFGPLLTYNKRSAFIDFESIKTSVEVKRPDLFSFGLCGGLRLPLYRALRAQVDLSIDAGNSADDTLYTTHTSLDKYYYYHASLDAALHCALAPREGRAVPFLVLSAGANGVWVNERTFFLDQPYQEVIYLDRDYVNEVSWSVSAQAGLGLDITLGGGVGISLISTFRFLYPVSYRIKEDFPLYAMKYKETLYGNVTWVGITILIK